MNEQEKHGELDELLDSLLAKYVDAEPRPGMETRLLANLRATSLAAGERRRRIWRWLLAGAGAVVVAAILFAIYLTQLSQLPQPPKIEVAGPPSRPPITVFHTPAQRPRKSRVIQQDATGSMAVANVRREVFPVPTPLSDQERLLMQYLARTPKEEVAAHSHSDKPEDTLGVPVPQSQQFTETETQGNR